MSIATKVMIQIACKLGAEPWRVSVPTHVTKIHHYYLYFFLNKFFIIRNGWLSVMTRTMMLVREKLLVPLLLQLILLLPDIIHLSKSMKTMKKFLQVSKIIFSEH